MLKAVLHRKLRVTPLDPETTPPCDLPEREDLLTSAVAERMAYLNPDLAWALLRDVSEVLHGEPLPPVRPQGLVDWSFWPRYASRGACRNARYVEPDVVVSWGELVLVIEVKHRGQQDAAQWVDQVHALRAVPNLAAAPLWLMAAGGLEPSKVGPQRDAFVSALGERAPGLLFLHWNRLSEVIHTRLQTPLPPATAVILRDIRSALAAWGYRPRQSFASLPMFANRHRIHTTAGALQGWRGR
ncbi:hypothetical protein [Chondromyces crocatus]|uniref:Uncharacterized protein n=1 Tax=Chondromyces crocatus TaxID=52 RepID=A0A0K1E5F0_CHOCO|nr:hypothetical protein [Chondromyces crocatus]AKT36095.1 uncharacterized protein CMC5_002080 [Chondromyces crocatus]